MDELRETGRTVLELEVFRHFAYECESADRLVAMYCDGVGK